MMNKVVYMRIEMPKTVNGGIMNRKEPKNQKPKISTDDEYVQQKL